MMFTCSVDSWEDFDREMRATARLRKDVRAARADLRRLIQRHGREAVSKAVRSLDGEIFVKADAAQPAETPSLSGRARRRARQKRPQNIPGGAAT